MVGPPEAYEKGDPIAGIGFKRVLTGGNDVELQQEKQASAGPAAALMHAVTGAEQRGAWRYVLCVHECVRACLWACVHVGEVEPKSGAWH
jgi:hypothetical protein